MARGWVAVRAREFLSTGRRATGGAKHVPRLPLLGPLMVSKQTF